MAAQIWTRSPQKRQKRVDRCANSAGKWPPRQGGATFRRLWLLWVSALWPRLPELSRSSARNRGRLALAVRRLRHRPILPQSTEGVGGRSVYILVIDGLMPRKCGRQAECALGDVCGETAKPKFQPDGATLRQRGVGEEYRPRMWASPPGKQNPHRLCKRATRKRVLPGELYCNNHRPCPTTRRSKRKAAPGNASHRSKTRRRASGVPATRERSAARGERQSSSRRYRRCL